MIVRIYLRAAPAAIRALPVVARAAAQLARTGAVGVRVGIAALRAMVPVVNVSARAALFVLRNIGLPTARISIRILSRVAVRLLKTFVRLLLISDDVTIALAKFLAEQVELIGPDPVLVTAEGLPVNTTEAAQMLPERAKERLKPAMMEAMSTGASAGMDASGAQLSFNVENPEVDQFLESHTIRLVDQLAGTTRLEARRIILEGQQAGMSLKEIADRIREIDPEASAMRAFRIARTETARAFVEGQRQAWSQSGVVGGKMWLLSPNPCQFCIALDRMFRGKSIPVDEPFLKRGTLLVGSEGGRMLLDYEDIMGPPLHPNCRCDLTPVLN